MALEEWVVNATPPPDSLVPSVTGGTGAVAASLHFPAIPGVSWPKGGNAAGLPVDWTDPPASFPAPLPTLVSKLDADGNEVAGLRLPDIAVPVATYTGTNLYRDAAGELCDRDGTYVPFAATRAAREAAGDPRLSLEERYGTRDAFVARLRAAAEALVAARLLLVEDADRYVAAAREIAGF